MHARSSPGRLSVAVLLATVMVGCSGPLDPATRPTLATDPAEPAASASISMKTGPKDPSSFYPLQIGNRWRHARVFDVRVVPNDGSAPWLDRSYSARQSEILCIQSFDGVPYVVERATEHAPNGTFLAWTFYRQDATGLYERDRQDTDPRPCQGTAAEVADRDAASATLGEKVIEDLLATRSAAEREAFGVALRKLYERVQALDMIRPAGAAAALALLPGGARPGELTRLRYPLEPNRGWAIRDDPDFRMTAVVEGPEVLDLPPGRLRGHRIRLETDVFGPKDAVRVWYGRAGYLQLVAHFELDATDALGNITGRAIVDERETLVDLSLADQLVAVPPKLRPRR